MRRTLLILAMLLAPFALALAFAQALPGGADPGKPATWFLTAAGWGGLVALAVSFFKTNLIPLRGFGTIAASFALAVGGALVASTGLLAVAGVNLEATTAEAVTFGLTAFIASSGGWDFGVGVVKTANVAAMREVE